MGEISSYCVCVCDVGLLFKQLQYKVRDLFGNCAVIRKSKARVTKNKKTGIAVMASGKASGITTI